MRLKIKPWRIRIPLPGDIVKALKKIPSFVWRLFGVGEIRPEIEITVPLDGVIEGATVMLSDEVLWDKARAFCKQMGADEELTEQYVGWLKTVLLTEIAQAEEG